MKLDPGVFRQYDIRGRADEDLHDAFVVALGRAFATTVARSGRPARIAVGRDCRLSGPRIRDAFVQGLRASGADVVDIGVVPTPLLYFATHTLPDIGGGGMITGSHNPPAWNGFKMCLGTDSLHGDGLQDLRRLMEAEDLDVGEGAVEVVDVREAYLSHVRGDLTTGRPLKVVVDAGNGTGGIVAGALYRALGHEVTELYCGPDGTFPNHHPDPTVEANLADLREAVKTHGADLGIAFDGDADRIGAIDANGRVAWGDQLLLFFARALLKDRPGARIIGEVKCSRTLYDGIRDAGGEPEMWKVGHSLIKARMKETGAPLAGEMSGHIFFADRYFGYDDAPYVGARLLELLSHSDKTLAQMLDGLPPTHTTPELRVACPDADKFAVAQRAVAHFGQRYQVNDIDGVRIDFPHGWGLLRPSNTQPVLVMRFEADNPERLEAYRDEVESWLRAAAPEVDLEADTHH